MGVERQEPSTTAGEREMLDGWLEYHRRTLESKCEGLTAEQLKMRSCPPSTLSLLGLVRHMVEVERGWFRRILAGEDVDGVYFTDDRPNDDFDNTDSHTPEEVFAKWRAECDYSDDVAKGISLDAVGKKKHGRTGEEFNLRWIMTHMIEEYARHNGHADLLREAIDGTTGD